MRHARALLLARVGYQECAECAVVLEARVHKMAIGAKSVWEMGRRVDFNY